MCVFVYMYRKKEKIRERPVCRLAWQPCDKEGFCLLRSIIPHGIMYTGFYTVILPRPR